MGNSMAHSSTPPPPTHCHGRGFLKNVTLNASRQTCYLKSGWCPAHPLIIFSLMLLSLPCLALGDTELETHVRQGSSGRRRGLRQPGLWGHREEGSGQRFTGQKPWGPMDLWNEGQGEDGPRHLVWGLGPPEMGTQEHENQGHGRPASGTQERSATSTLDLRRI